MRPRVTVSVQTDGSFDIFVNEAGRDLLVEELRTLSERSDHIHLDYYDDVEIADATDVPLSPVGYQATDRVLLNGKILFRPDKWDLQYYPHVMAAPEQEA